MSDYDPFQLSTGLPDKLDVSIRQAWFEFDPEYNNGQTLILKMEVESTDDDYGENGVGILMYPCGNGWQTSGANGESAEREDGNERKGFNNNSAYGLFIGAAIGCDGAEAVLRSEGRGDPRYAPMWVSTAWHLDRVEKDYGGEIGKVSRLLPTSFLGEMESIRTQGGAKKAAGPVKAAAKKLPAAKVAAKKAPAPVKVAAKKVGGAVKKASPPPATAPPVDELPADDAGGEMFETLVELALTCYNHEQFIERAYAEVDGVNGVADVEQMVLTQEEGSPWAEAVARWEASQG